MAARPERAILVALFSLSAATSVLLDAGVVSPNDGSHYALVRALADGHTVVIDDYAEYARQVDVSRRGEHFYSDKAPGTAFAALPFYLVARAAGLSDEARQQVCVLLSVLAGAFAVILTYLLARRLALGAAAAAAAALTLALCTPHRTYASTLFSHALSACLVTLCAWLATPPVESDGEAPATPLGRLGLGLAAGYAIAVDFSSAMVTLPMCAVVAAAALRRGGEGEPAWRTIVPLAGGVALGVLPALVYNAIAFGGPFTTGYHFHVLFPETRSFVTMYGGSFFTGLFGLLLSWRAGLLLYSPILILAPFAAPKLVRAIGRRRALTALLPIALLVFLTANHATWDGGGAHDARYLLAIVPLLCVLVGAAYARASRPALLHGFTALFVLSALVQLCKHGLGWLRSPLPTIADTLGRMSFDADGVQTFDGTRIGDWFAAMFPHPLFAIAILVVGLAVAAALARRRAPG